MASIVSISTCLSSSSHKLASSSVHGHLCYNLAALMKLRLLIEASARNNWQIILVIESHASNFLSHNSWTTNIWNFWLTLHRWHPRTPSEEFESEHIPGAVFLDIDAIDDTGLGLPHMMPSPAAFRNLMETRLRIEPDAHIVVYDSSKCGYAGTQRIVFM